MARKAKLVYVLHEIAIGGAEVAFLSALPMLAKEFDLRVFVIHKSDQKLLETIPIPLRKHFVFCNVSLTFYPLYVGVLVARILTFGPRYLVCSLWRSCVVGSLVKMLKRSICYYSFIHSSTFFHKMDRWSSKAAMRVSDAVFVDSRSARDFVVAGCGISEGKVEVISFITEQAPRTVPNYDFLRTHFVFVGRLHPVKNVPMAVRVIAWLRRNGIHAFLDIYGRDDGDDANVRHAIQQAGLEEYVVLKGELLPPDKERVLSGVDYPFYLQLSQTEGMAMSVVEAMQAGKVCVLTAVGEIPHYASDGESAVFIDYASDERWSQTMSRMLSVITDVVSCQRISVAAHHTFQEKPLFRDALLEAIIKKRDSHA